MAKRSRKSFYKVARRLIMAGAFSGLGFLATKLWYDSVKRVAIKQDEPGFARLVDTRGEVQRRRANRVIWQGADSLAELTSGDSIRTGSRGGTNIEFANTKTIVELDPDSLVTVRSQGGSVTVDFQKGSLVVKRGTGDERVTVLSGDQPYNASTGEFALAKTPSGALIETDLSSSGSLHSGSFQILSPRPFSTVFVPLGADPSLAIPFLFEWLPLPKSSHVRLQVGPSPSELSEVTGIAAHAAPGRIATPLKVGVHYWRLIAYSPTGQPIAFSHPMKLDLRPKTAPIQIFPLADSSLRVRPADTTIRFRWSNPARIEHLRFELVQTVDGKSKTLRTEDLPGRETQFSIDLPDAGEYRWRVSGVGSTSLSSLPAQFAKFTISTQSDLAPPVLVKPINDETIPLSRIRDSGLYLSWRAIADAESYKVMIRTSKGVATREAQSNSLKISDFTSGEMTWSVIAVGNDGAQSDASELWKFRVETVRTIPWTGMQTPDTLTYAGTSPQGVLAFDASQLTDVSQWRVRLGSSSEMLSAQPWQTISSTQFTQTFAKDDEYVAEIEGLNSKGQVVAKSPKRKFSVRTQSNTP